MVDSGGERYFGRLEGVVGREVDGEEKNTALIGALWWSHDGRLPVEQVVADGAGTALSWWVTTEVLELLKQNQPFKFFKLDQFLKVQLYFRV